MDCARETRPASAAARAGSGVACSAAIPCHGETSPSSAGNGLPRSTRRHSSLDANSAISLVSTTGPSISCSCETMAADWQALNWNSMWRCRQVRLLERISFNFHAKLSSSLLRYVQTKSLYKILVFSMRELLQYFIYRCFPDLHQQSNHKIYRVHVRFIKHDRFKSLSPTLLWHLFSPCLLN